MQIEFADLIRLDFSNNPNTNTYLSYVFLSFAAVVLIMQVALMTWNAHLTPDEIHNLNSSPVVYS